MSMRSDFEDIIQTYGHDVYLQRGENVDEEIVYPGVLEKHTVRFSVGIHRNLPRAREEAKEGVTNTTDRTYYFKYDVKPYENDRIYDYLDRAPDDQEVYLINSTVGMRGEDGHIAFWACGVTRSEPN